MDTCSNGALCALCFKRLETRSFGRFIEKTHDAFFVLQPTALSGRPCSALSTLIVALHYKSIFVTRCRRIAVVMSPQLIARGRTIACRRWSLVKSNAAADVSATSLLRRRGTHRGQEASSSDRRGGPPRAVGPRCRLPLLSSSREVLLRVSHPHCCSIRPAIDANHISLLLTPLERPTSPP